MEGDALPGWLSDDAAIDLLCVHYLKSAAQGGGDQRSNMVVVTPNLQALIQSDAGAVIDLAKGELILPKYGKWLKIKVCRSTTVENWPLMLTPTQIRAQVTAIRKRMSNGSRAFAIHAHSAWMGPDQLEVAGEQHRVASCQSDLQVREALLRSEVEQQPCILLCNFDPAHIWLMTFWLVWPNVVFYIPRPVRFWPSFSGRESLVLACLPVSRSWKR